MLIDVILDRRAGYGIYHNEYRAKDFYDYLVRCGDVCNYQDVARALDSGTEKDVKRELCRYIDYEYNPEIKEYIKSVQWLKDDMRMERRDKVITKTLVGLGYDGNFIRDLQGKNVFEDFIKEYRVATDTKKVVALTEKYYKAVAA